MDYIEFRIWKLVALGVLVFVWGIFCGVTGRPLEPARDEEKPPENRG